MPIVPRLLAKHLIAIPGRAALIVTTWLASSRRGNVTWVTDVTGDSDQFSPAERRGWHHISRTRRTALQTHLRVIRLVLDALLRDEVPAVPTRGSVHGDDGPGHHGDL